MSTEKRFPPSAKKLQKAKNKGDLPKSKDFTSALLLTLAIAILVIQFRKSELIVIFMTKIFLERADSSRGSVLECLAESAQLLMDVLWPFLAILWIAALAVEYLQSGIVIKAPRVSFSRLNPFENMKSIFGSEELALLKRPIFEVSKTAFVLLACLLLLACNLLSFIGPLMEAEFYSLAEFYSVCISWLFKLVWQLCLLVLLLGVADFVMARVRWRKKLRMDFEELRREQKESEGDPGVKERRRSLHQEVLIHGVLEGVRKASLLILGSKRA